ncbi:MAG: DUF1566 domain-containing protein [Candidatus Peribacteraceae bacterium]
MKRILTLVGALGLLTVSATVALAGNLSPSALPASTMHSLQELWDKIAGSGDTSSVTANRDGDVLQRLEWVIENGAGTLSYGDDSAAKVLTTATAAGTYNASNITATNVRSGITFGVAGTGTGSFSGNLAYGDDVASTVLTTASTPGTYNAANLSAATVKSGTLFGVGLTGAYPSAVNTLPSASATTDLAGNGTTITTGNSAVEWWQSDGTRQTATLDLPDASNVCSTDTVNGTTGTTTVSGALVATGRTYCGIAGTLLGSLFNGTSGAFTGGSQANGGADDYNAAGAPAALRYSGGWTACNASAYNATTNPGGNYCNTGDTGADAKDNSTNLVWSLPCNGSACASFSDSSPLTYSWDSSAVNNGARTASQICSDHSGWYLPHQKQLMQAYIDGSYGNLETSGVHRSYWSATTGSDSTTSAWFVYLSNGFTYPNGKTTANNVRCVRPAS